MDKESMILIGLLVVVAGGLVFALLGFTDGPSATTNTVRDGNIAPAAASAASGFKTITTGTTDNGEAEIALTPHDVADGKLVVDVAANTHSVDLSQFDLKQITTLEYDGKVIKPSSAPVLSGHHVSGELVFDAGEDLDSFTIKIKGIPAVQERVFEWK